MPVRKDRQGRWHAEICVAGQRLHRRLSEGAGKAEAKAVEAGLIRSLETGPRGADPLLTDLMAEYVRHAQKNLRSPDTAEHHANRLGESIAGMRASQATEAAAAIIDDLGELDYAPATINRSLGTLKKALSMAFERRLIDVDEGARIRRLPENNARDTVLSLDQVRAIADQASASVRACIWIAIYTGMRRGEILKLRREDIQAEALLVKKGNTKTLQTRLVPIIEPLRPHLEAVPVPLTFEGLKTGWGRARTAAGMTWATFHDLRRSCGTLMIQAGVDLYTVSKVLGHSTVTVTQQRYAHLQIGAQAEALKRTFGG